MNQSNVSSDLIEFLKVPQGGESYDIIGSNASLVLGLVELQNNISLASSSDLSFSQAVWPLFQADPFFSEVDRIAIVTRSGLSNNLWVNDFFQTPRAQKSDLIIGYSCFVSPQSSLFKLNANQMRVFADANEIVNHFYGQNKTPQKSIQLIAESGLKSGACLPIFRWGTLVGFLFLNSIQPNYFKDMSKEDISVLRLLTGVARTWLSQRISEPHGYLDFLNVIKSSNYAGDLFDIQNTEKLLSIGLDYLGIKDVKTKIIGCPLWPKPIWVDYNFVYIMSYLCLNIPLIHSGNLELVCERTDESWLIFKVMGQWNKSESVSICRRLKIFDNLMHFLDMYISVYQDTQLEIKVFIDASYFSSDNGPYSISKN